jgi:hypothetical protein
MTAPTPTERKGSTPEERRNFEDEIKRKQAEASLRRALWEGLNGFVRVNGGWVTSPFNGSSLRIEAPPDSDLVDKLIDRGFDLQPISTGSRIEGGIIRPVCIYNLRLPSMRK